MEKNKNIVYSRTRNRKYDFGINYPCEMEIKVCQWHATGQWFSLGTPVSFTNKIDCLKINEILLKVVLTP
jgi:hypothetical protein